MAHTNFQVGKRIIILTLLCVSLSSCKSHVDESSMQPIEGYPFVDNVEVIKQILEAKCVDTIKFSKGEVIADIGAGNGYLEAMLSLFNDSLTFYIQDIDTSVCNPKALRDVVAFYQNVNKKPFTNKFITVNGSDTGTNLPDTTFDKVLMLWTYQYFKDPEAIMTDLKTKLKSDGLMYIVNPNISDDSGETLTSQYGWNASPLEKQISDIIDCGFELTGISRYIAGSEKPYIMVFRIKDL